MATSGSKNFLYTRNSIIEAALRKIGEYDPGEPVPQDELADAVFALNTVIQDFTVNGADIWLRQELTVFINKGQELYAIGETGDNVTESYVETALSAGTSLGNNNISVTSITGFTAGDYLGIKKDDGFIFWTTVASAVANTITLTDVIDGTASAGKKVYGYTTKAFRPHALLDDANNRKSDDGTETTIDLIGEQEYRNLSQKAQLGQVNQIFYKATLGNGSLYAWPTGDGNGDKLSLVANYYPDEFISATDSPEFPSQWASALIWGTAAELGPEYGISERRQRVLEAKSVVKLNNALDFDIENASVIFGRSR